MANFVAQYNFVKSDTQGNYRDAFPTSSQYGTYLINKATNVADATILTNISDVGVDRDAPNGLKSISMNAGNKAYIQLNPITSTNNGLSFTTWVLCEANGTWARIFDFGNGPGVDNIIIFINNNDIGLSVKYNGKESQPYGIIPKVTAGSGGQYSGQWFHIAWTLNPNGEWKIYVNGVLYRTLTGQLYPGVVKRNNMYIGRSNWNDPYFSGYIADFRIYNSVLSQNDVMTIYNGPSTKPQFDKDISWKWTWNDSKDNWTALRQNNLIGQWKDLGIDNNTNMTISFSIIINQTHGNWRNIMHITNDGNNCCNAGQRIPALWIFPNDTRLHFRFSSQDWGNNGCDSGPIGINKETYVTITINRSKINIYYDGNLNSSSFTYWSYVKAEPNAKIYIADPWHSIDFFIIKNFKMTNGNIYEKPDNTTTYDAKQDAWIFPKSIGTFYKLSPGEYITQWSNMGIKSISNMAITFTLNISAIQEQRWRSILHISNSGANWGTVGDRIPGIWLYPNENRLHICFSTTATSNSNPQEYFNSNRLLPFGVDCNVTIITYNKSCYCYIDNSFDSQINYNGTLISPNSDAIVYVCDPWHDRKDYNIVKIKDLKITNGNKIITPPDNVGNFVKKGCFRDAGTRAIPNYRGNVSNIEQCANLASINNENVFGLQYGGECWTGRNKPNSQRYGQLSDNECIMNGDDLGGGWSQFVYEGPDYTSPNYKLSILELDCYRKRYPDLAKLNDTQLQEQWTNVGANQNRDNQCPTIQQTSGLYEYRGSWGDQAGRAIPTLRNPTKSVSSVDECKNLAESNKETLFGLQNYGECWTSNNESDAYKYGAIYDKLKIHPLGTGMTNMVYVRKEAFPDPEPPVPVLTSPNFSDTPIEKFNNMEESNVMNMSEKICGLILLLLFIIILLIIYKFNKK